MLADMQAVMNGRTHATSTLDIEQFRLLVRHAVLSLPPHQSQVVMEGAHPVDGPVSPNELALMEKYIKEYGSMHLF